MPLYLAEDGALLPMVRPLVDRGTVRTARAGRRSPLAGLDLVVSRARAGCC
ncbi:hypothetical protein [Streptomyces sp. 147326]|uniref:hypothetical protein n=1 Tax=Streptomyces sp. 147326 TaxID=3074379 RepID=UPI003857AA13